MRIGQGHRHHGRRGHQHGDGSARIAARRPAVIASSTSPTGSSGQAVHFSAAGPQRRPRRRTGPAPARRRRPEAHQPDHRRIDTADGRRERHRGEDREEEHGVRRDAP
ncbi:hypothetical protein OG331_24805 [Streptomyces sp. NBC_01017]|uniref:hypothetical protein n=1 Tax=Streptomyces sp. NBC_01017 TaxID=2903721 RepID=UPI00386CB7F2|nr:hypothetical protein OG331_24805 [Streptomyces sp. NBC_01017]